MIEAQRFEAAEARVASEKERRANQQKARKQQRKAAHQKHVSRVVAKKYLIGLKQNAISTLAGMSLLHPKLECDLHEDVLPWLMAKKETFSTDQDDSIKMADHLIEQGILARSKAHARTMKARRDKERALAEDAANADVRQAERRAERQAARAKRAKDQAKTKMRDEIRRILIDKGSVVQPVTE